MTDAIYLFGAYRLDPEKGVFRGDREVALPPKELELLRLLVSLEGKVASHEVIEDALWPRQVVSYASLARCVYSLRKHLDAEGETYIQTVPKRGYRMIAPLKKQPGEKSANARILSIMTTPLAYSHYLEGLRAANEPDPEGQQQAVHWYREALQVDPEFAPAYAAIADVHLFQVIRGFLEPVEGLKLARIACQEALKLNPVLVSALAAQAWIKGILDAAPREALALLDEALELDPDYARGYAYRAWLLRTLCRVDEIVEAVRHSVELDPHSVFNRHALAWGLFSCGHAEDALALERQIQAAHPMSRDDIPYMYSSVFLVHLGRHEEAIDAAYEALRISRGNPGVQAVTAYALATIGEASEARKLLQEAEAARLPRAPRTLLAAAYLALGERDTALELLRRARSEHCVWLPPARLDPRLAPLRDDPDFLALFD